MRKNSPLVRNSQENKWESDIYDKNKNENIVIKENNTVEHDKTKRTISVGKQFSRC
jgi:hypothetical protein